MEQNVCDEFLRLRYNPLQIFKASKTPAGLYARQKWLDESGTATFLDSHRISANGRIFSARTFIIATGISPVIPNIQRRITGKTFHSR